MTRALRSAVLLSALASSAGAAAVPSAPVVLVGGEAAVTEADLAAWSAAQACYGPDALASRRAAFARLTEAALAERALRAAGGPDLSDAAVAADAARIDRETQAPDILACIKAALKDDYLRAFVRPSFVEASLRRYLMEDKAAQGGPRAKAADALSRARAGKSLQAAAKELGLSYSSATFTLDVSSVPPAPGLPPAGYQKDFIERALSGLAPGSLAKEPYEDGYSFQALRLVRRAGDEWTFETAVAAKLGQKEWLASFPKFKVRVLDPELAAWARAIKGNPRFDRVDWEGAK